MIGTAAVLKEQDFILSSLAPSPGQNRLAVAAVIVLAVAFLAIKGPLETVQLPRLDAYFPIYATAMFVNDSITALLLFAQFTILRSRALLAISSAYLFTSLMMIPRILAFPGALGPTGLIGGVQSAAWLYVISHTGFSVLILAYALLKDREPAVRPWGGPALAAILATAGATAVVVGAATYLVTAMDSVAPRLMRDAVHYTPLWPYAAAVPLLVSVAAVVVLGARRWSVLDLWLMVVMCASAIDVALIAFPATARFSISWYAGRSFEAMAGSLVLLVLLYEITTLYARLLRAISAQRRERAARLMTGDAVSASIAHEIRQPLAAMTASAAAGRRWLNRETPDFAEATAAFEAISLTGKRASTLIEGIRAMFRKDAATRASVDLNALVSEALDLLRGELRTQRIAVLTELSGGTPRVTGDRVQLQQVIVNLISNAIDAMAGTGGPRELRVASAVDEAGGAVVSVADTGPGIAPRDAEQIFNPLFTTKTHGMGMGLSICRSIVEAHKGRLWVTPNRPSGAIFHLTVPAGAPDPEAADVTVTSRSQGL